MSNQALIQKLIDQNTIESCLCRNSADTDSVKILQEGLYHLGFGRELKWKNTGPDGAYGPATARTVALFARRNSIDTDGDRVDIDLGRLIVQRLAFLDEMHHLYEAAENDTTLKLLYRGSSERVAISVLQTILNELGYGEHMNWARYGADGDYGPGTSQAVLAFAQTHALDSDGVSVTQEMARKALAGFIGFYGDDWYRESQMLPRVTLSISESNKTIAVSDGEHGKTFRRFRRGIYTIGDRKALDFIETNRDLLRAQGLTDSAMNVMVAVSENEGNLDAINTWDNSFMTFGMFQWTIGAGEAAGELPALLKKIKQADPEVFEKYYGRHGLDVTEKTDATHGFVKLHGNTLKKRWEKEQLRSPIWSFYFWKSGQDPLVQAVQIEHALSRLSVFYRSRSYQVDGHDIADIITSEYGVGLILDNHVNRPGYIKPTLQRAVERAGLSGSNPKNWGNREERTVIDHYLAIRERYGRSPMTDAGRRAKVTRKYLDRGIISAERGSFQYAL